MRGENNIKNDLISQNRPQGGRLLVLKKHPQLPLKNASFSTHFVNISLLLLLLLHFIASYGPFILYIFPLFNILNRASHDIFAQ